MKVGIIGMGRVGSSIAAYLMFHPKVNEIYINDINIDRCQAEYEDLRQSAALLDYKVKIKVITDETFEEFQECQYLFIAAGHPRLNSRESMKHLYDKNYSIINSILNKMPHTFFNAEFPRKIYIATNPWEMFSIAFKIRPLGPKLDDIRVKLKARCGPWILDRKGYTNWGIAAEAYKVIE